MENLVSLLAEDIILWTDGGGKARAAEPDIRSREGHPVLLEHTRKGLARLPPSYLDQRSARRRRLRCGRPLGAGTLEVEEGRIRAMRFVVNPE